MQLRAALGLVVLAALGAGPASAHCRLALALGFDVSRSVDARAYALQAEGLQAALADAQIRAAILDLPGHVELAVFEWSGRWHQQVVAGWTSLRDAADIDALATQLRGQPRTRDDQQTAVGQALEFGARLLLARPDCAERVLDIAGDGRNNDGPSPAQVYARRNFGDIVVNGLAIEGLEADIATHYREQVIRGPGAFVEIAASPEDIADALRRKLLRELEPGAFAAHRAADVYSAY